MKQIINFFNCLDWTLIAISVAISIVIGLVLYFVLQRNFIGKTLFTICLIIGIAWPIAYCYNTYYPGSGENYNPILDNAVENIKPNDCIDVKPQTGFDRTWVKEEEAKEDCPTAEDKHFYMNIVEYKDTVVYSYDTVINGQPYTMNVVFYKQDNSIVINGACNVRVAYKVRFLRTDYWFENLMYEGNTFTPVKNPYDYDNRYGFLDVYNKSWSYIIPTSMGTPSIFGKKNFEGADNIERKTAQNGVYRIFNDYFKQFDSVCILMNFTTLVDGSQSVAEDPARDMNAFYNLVFDEVKKANASDVQVDVTNITSDYVDGKVYKSNRYLNINYANYSNNLLFAKPGKSIIDNKIADDIQEDNIKEKEDIKVVIDDLKETYEEVTTSKPKVVFKLNNKNNTELSGFDITKTPVKIELTSADETTKHEFLFDTFAELNKGISTYINKGAYSYKITSDILDFSGTVGALEVTGGNTFIFDYEYTYGIVDVKVTLSKISNLDLSSFDISATPVTINFTNKTSTYTFKFDTLEKLNNGITRPLPIGEYDWSIQSSELTFTKLVGHCTVSMTEYKFDFAYDYKTNVEYSTNVAITNVTANAGDNIEPYRSVKLKLNLPEIEGLKTINLSYYISAFGNTGKVTVSNVSNNKVIEQIMFMYDEEDYTSKEGQISYALQFVLDNGESITTNISNSISLMETNDYDLVEITITVSEIR